MIIARKRQDSFFIFSLTFLYVVLRETEKRPKGLWGVFRVYPNIYAEKVVV
jgi:hypothetical protein